MLDTIRQFAAEQLTLDTTAAERFELRRRHAHYFASLADRAQLGLESAKETTWTMRLERDDANLRAAFTTANDAPAVTNNVEASMATGFAPPSPLDARRRNGCFGLGAVVTVPPEILTRTTAPPSGS